MAKIDRNIIADCKEFHEPDEALIKGMKVSKKSVSV